MSNSALREFLQLLYPPICIGCRVSGWEFCTPCAREMKSPIIRSSISGIPFLAKAHYSKVTAQLILSAKEDNNRNARVILSEAISEILQTLPGDSFTIIPIPSRTPNNRRRGYEHMPQLLRLVQKTCEKEIYICNGLEIVGRIADQSTLGSRERELNMHGSYRIRPKEISGIERGSQVVLIDDLVTSGSTMREGIQTLKLARIGPKAVISACVASGHRGE